MFHRMLRRGGRALCLAVLAIGGLSLSGCVFIPHGHHHHHDDCDDGGWERHHHHGYYDRW